MKKELEQALKRIRSGKSAIHNDDKEKCKGVITFIFPEDESTFSGGGSFYYARKDRDSLCDCDEYLPSRFTHTYKTSELYKWMIEPESPDSINYEEIEVLLVCAGKLKNNKKLEQQVLNIVKQLL